MTTTPEQIEAAARALWEKFGFVPHWDQMAAHDKDGWLDRARTALEAAERVRPPIGMVLHCPKCGEQHIDAPNTLKEIVHQQSGTVVDELWTNPPHRSHLCHACGHLWRPADVPTNGVAAVQTKGQHDSPIAGLKGITK